MRRGHRLVGLACAAALLAGSIYVHRTLEAASGDVTELAPGVFFREQAGGCNNGWVVFEDYVLVVDANFPHHATKVVEEIRKTSEKPIRFVFDTHYHGDHAFGNAVYTSDGAVAVATRRCLDELVRKGHPAFKAALEDNKDWTTTVLKNPTLLFDEWIVFDDGTHRVELLYFGHAHTRGDAVAYLPNEKILFTGDACVNGAFNYTGDADTENWIRVLDALEQLDVTTVAPGHGSPAGPELIGRQRRWFVELRAAVAAGIDEGKTLEAIQQTTDIPFYEEWTGVPAKERTENIEHVYAELTGQIMPSELERLGLKEAAAPVPGTTGGDGVKKIVVPSLSEKELANLRLLAPGVDFVPVADLSAAVDQAADADAVIGFCSEELVRAGTRLRWIQVGSAGVERYVTIEPLVASDVVLTNTQRIYGPEVADHAMGLLLALVRSLRGTIAQQATQATWDRSLGRNGRGLRGKTMLVVGLGGVGSQVARRAHGFGMRVLALDPKVTGRPPFVHELAPPDQLDRMLPEADVIVVCAPLTSQTRGMFGSGQFDRMKTSAILVNVARGPTLQTDALVEALNSGKIAGAALDVTDPEPLPDGHPLWEMPNVVITPHIASSAPEKLQRRWLLWRENVRRFAAGEPLLAVVDKKKGY